MLTELPALFLSKICIQMQEERVIDSGPQGWLLSLWHLIDVYTDLPGEQTNSVCYGMKHISELMAVNVKSYPIPEFSRASITIVSLKFTMLQCLTE